MELPPGFQPVYTPVCGKCHCPAFSQCNRCRNFYCSSHLQASGPEPYSPNEYLCEICQQYYQTRLPAMGLKRKIAIRVFATLAIIASVAVLVRISFSFD